MQPALYTGSEITVISCELSQKQVNFEVYHALTDGTGAMNFITELVQDYLILAYPEVELPRIEMADEVTPGEKEEDSFSQYYSSKIPKNKEKKPPAVQLKGEKLVHSDMQITEVIFSVKRNTGKIPFLRGVHHNISDSDPALCNS